MSTIWPLAVMRPAIAEGSGPMTRLSVTAVGPGCWKVTACWLPTSKLRQSIAARGLDCVMVVVRGAVAMLAWPATTWPPVGRALGAGCARAGPHARPAAVRAVVASIANLARPSTSSLLRCARNDEDLSPGCGLR